MFAREGWLVLTLLICLVAISALLVVHNSFQNRQHFIELNKISQQFTEMRIEFGRLQIEHGTWASPAMVESLAESKLDMQVPSVEQVVLIDRQLGRNESKRQLSIVDVAGEYR